MGSSTLALGYCSDRSVPCVRGINQVCRGKRRSPATFYTALEIHSPRTWCRCTVRTQPCASAWKKREMEQLKHLFGTTWYLSALLQLFQPQ